MTQQSQADPNLVEAVDALLRAAFETGAEADLVKVLRADKAMATEILYRGEGGLEGYAALSQMQAPEGWLCLAPVAVAPKQQCKGIGAQVLKLALKWAEDRGLHTVVLGDPSYYGRHGFSQARAANIKTPYSVEHTLLAGPGEDAPAEELVYPAAFGSGG